jgi:hypothetical protein
VADLSDAAYQGIASVTFRYYPITDQSGRTIEISSMVLNGEAVVPEPGVLALVGLGSVMVMRRRRS